MLCAAGDAEEAPTGAAASTRRRCRRVLRCDSHFRDFEIRRIWEKFGEEMWKSREVTGTATQRTAKTAGRRDEGEAAAVPLFTEGF